MKVFGFIGCGNMGSALADCVIRAVGAQQVTLCERHPEKTAMLEEEYGVICAPFEQTVKSSLFLFLAVKPNAIEPALRQISQLFSGEAYPVLISMAAGVPLSDIREIVGNRFPLIRIMPNLSVAVGKGIVLYCTDGVSQKEEEIFLKSLSLAGRAEKVDEDKMDAASAVSGCGPAFAFQMIEAMSDGGVACGLSRDAALRLAAETLSGAASMVKESGKHPAELKDAVCSPGGSTISGVRLLERRAFRGAVCDAVIAAYEKTKELR